MLLQLIQDMQLMQGEAEVTFTDVQRQQLLPFWSGNQFGAILQRLSAQGVIQTHGQNPWHIYCEQSSFVPHSSAEPVQPVITEPPPPSVEAVPVYTVNEARMRNQSDDDLAYLKQQTPVFGNHRARRSKMHSEWEPSEDFPQLLSFHDIPIQFALSELAKFRQYYAAKDRMEISWDVPFLNWVQRAWHNSLNTKGRHDRQQSNNGEPADSARTKRSQVRDALRNIQDTDW
ncbi:MAG: DnaT-like ssDNA-binding domain-containing protein [Reinekea sp.]